MFLLVTINVLLCVASAQLPRPCDSPKQWEGRIITVDRKENYFRRGRISYDEPSSRWRIVEEETEGRQVDYYDILYLHNVGKEYRLNLKTRQCNVTTITHTFRPYGVPREANFTGEATIGAAGIPGENVAILNFAGQYQDGTKFFGDVTSPDCIPVSNGEFNDESGFVLNTYGSNQHISKEFSERDFAKLSGP
ncbi:mammalian ependymin-related protein 1-like [Saccostrea echinata]|uniref:mammalian ependymin-related protein 1-like n=1 Tax=Saccostrea echinata TaxID=191078 RepID=UPI002A811FEF|nr:mammalian ependymin-related protein 1-like [Saccostrea echinata]